MPDTTQTNIATEITRIQNDRNTIRTKLVELGMAESTSNLDTLATAISGITNQGAVSATVKEGDTYTIQRATTTAAARFPAFPAAAITTCKARR